MGSEHLDGWLRGGLNGCCIKIQVGQICLRIHSPSEPTGAHVAGRKRVAEAWKVYLSGLLTSIPDPVPVRAGKY